MPGGPGEPVGRDLLLLNHRPMESRRCRARLSSSPLPWTRRSAQPGVEGERLAGAPTPDGSTGDEDVAYGAETGPGETPDTSDGSTPPPADASGEETTEDEDIGTPAPGEVTQPGEPGSV